MLSILHHFGLDNIASTNVLQYGYLVNVVLRMQVSFELCCRLCLLAADLVTRCYVLTLSADSILIHNAT
eukprot:4741604-Amphidinium_carterae.1